MRRYCDCVSRGLEIRSTADFSLHMRLKLLGMSLSPVTSTLMERSVMWERKAFLICLTIEGGEASKKSKKFQPELIQIGFPSAGSTIKAVFLSLNP